MPQNVRRLLFTVYGLATIQLVWCYLWLTRPYVNTRLYEQGKERMPFQGRLLMMAPMHLAHQSTFLRVLDRVFKLSHFWFPKPVQPEVLIQAVIGIACLAVTGVLTTRIYQASSRRGVLTPLIYPLVLTIWAATYVLHTVQNFRFIYDLPSLAFFTTAMYLIYFRRHWVWFVALFLVATTNRETTLLLLPLFAIDRSILGGRIRWRRLWLPQTLAVVLPLMVFWIGWEIFVRHLFAGNRSEFYPRLNWNVKSLVAPQAWPQLVSACGYLLPFVVLLRGRIPDARLRAWQWMMPMWLLFMFSYGILIETRVFGELIPLVACSAALILEELLVAKIAVPAYAAGAEHERLRHGISRAA